MKNRFNKMINELAVNTLANSFKMIDNVQHLFDDFDTQSFTTDLISRRDSIVRKGNDWLNDLGDFFKQVKETVTAFTVTVPFDSEKEEISVNVNDGVLKVETTFKNETTERKTFNSVTIPEDCDVDRMSQKVDNEKKLAVIIIPKKKKEGDTVSDKLKNIVAAAREQAAAKKQAQEPHAVDVVEAKKKAKKPIKAKTGKKTKKA